jgi:type I restriction-modification system DNA methylase subunit
LASSIQTLRSDLEKLIGKFQAEKDYYLSGDYLEAQARVDFITPFFKALGWDMENEAGLAHHQREVIVERGESEATGRPDYNFRIGGQTKFFVEAKAPSEALSNPHHILQAKGYVWNTRQVFFVILTDFEEFRFYDASRQPDERNPDEGLLLDLKYGDYLSNLEKLWEFSKERVAAGSLDALLPKARRAPHLRRQVDDVFLDEMTGWREELAKDIHKRNPALTAKQLNEVVQRLLDRIVFIRIAEDRHVIEKRQLAEVVEEWETHGGKFPIFDWLNDLFHKINEDFNGEIFKPHLSEEIQIDSEILARIIKRLYPPQSPYRFDVIGVELLGSIYERYLGNTIRLTPKQVRVEEKPEVRKAGGVYYTPKYIVDYIVKNTVGRVIEGKTPKQIEKIRILDPACGSGSFLIGAFQYLIDYHTQWYLEHPEQEVRHAHPSLDFMREVHTDPDGSKRLSVYRKAKILRHNLFGVDIDPQAVEITMMSLYLKALEGEQSQLPPKQHLLPELKYNIMCGNSLIGPDIEDQGSLFEDENGERINPFDWELAFPDPLKRGGFDAVIGNPPWGADFTASELAYLRDKCRRVVSRMIDSYIYFIDRSITVAKPAAPVGLVVPSTILNQVDAKPVRELLLSRGLSALVSLGQGIFGTSVLNTSTVFVSSNHKERNRIALGNLSALPLPDRAAALEKVSRASRRRWESLVRRDPDCTFFVGEFDAVGLLDRLRRKHIPLKTIIRGEIQRGVSPDIVGAHIVSRGEAKKEKLETALLRPSISGTIVKRYAPWRSDQLIIYTTPETDLRAYPRVAHHLAEFRAQNSCKEVLERKHPWWSLHRARDPEIFVSPKFIGLTTSKTIELIYDRDASLYVTDAMYVFSVDASQDPWVLMAILQSRLFLFLYRVANQGESRVIPQVKASKLESLPYPRLVPKDQRVSDLREMCLHMLDLNKKKHSGKLAPSQLARIDLEIEGCDREIDDLVYDLYGVTDAERKIVEGRP